MSSFSFDPEAYKVPHSFGGYDPNEKGLFQYPRKPLESSALGGPDRDVPRLASSPHEFQCQVPAVKRGQEGSKGIHHKIANGPQKPILDPSTTHYKIFSQDPAMSSGTTKSDFTSAILYDDGYTGNHIRHKGKEESPSGVSPLGLRRFPEGFLPEEKPMETLTRKPIDPIHWKPDLFDTPWEKYYLKNILIEDPYREFLSSCSEATLPQHYCSEYRQSFSGNPTLSTASSGNIVGLSRPTDIPEPIHDWKRFKTQKFRDVNFSHEKDATDSHLDYNDPKRYNPWPRLFMGYNQMVEPNHRPRPRSGVEYSVTTVLPAVSPYSKQWII